MGKADISRVFWDMKDFPFRESPEQLTSLHRRVEAAFASVGNYGSLDINVYGGDGVEDDIAAFLFTAELQLVYEGDDKSARLEMMLLDMIKFSYKHHFRTGTFRAHLIMVSKDIPEEDKDFCNYVIEGLEKRGHQVYLVSDDDAWTSLMNGIYPF